MSQFLGGAGPAQLTIQCDDHRACDEDFRNDEDLFQPPRFIPQTWENFAEFAGFASPWWPARSSLMGGYDGVEGNDRTPTPMWGDNWTRSGCNSRLAFIGYSRDENGNIVGGCTIKCFRAADDTLQSSVLSDANGFYQATTPYFEAHYLVIQMPTTPLRAGASINTLFPG